MIQDFLTNAVFELQHSESESRRFGFSVARLLVPEGDAVSDEEIVSILQRSTSALVILRAESARTSLPKKLKLLDGFDFLHADTLLYYRWTISPSVKGEESRDQLKIVDDASWGDVESVLTESFSQYRNHYSANPHLSSSVTLSGYQEWAAALMNTPETLTLVARDYESSRAIGFLLVVVDHEAGLAEIVLNAVRPSAQRGGVYSALMREVQSRLAKLGDIRDLYISTQSDNHSVIGAWEKLGLTRRLTLDTFHLMRRGEFSGSISR
jgi:ribosomal protein S18 acetylase RimI-like enzyme